MNAGKWMRWKIAVPLSCVVIVSGALFWMFAGEPEVPLTTATADALSNTIVTPHLEEPVQPGKNLLWCSTFQLVWNEACRVAGGDIRLDSEPPMVASLNKKMADKSDVEPSSCLVMSGLIEDGIVANIRKALQEQFKGQATPKLLDSPLPAAGYVQYSYLYRDLPFEHKFSRLDKPLHFADGKALGSFGIESYGHGDHRVAEQVLIIDYVSNDDFVLQLQPKDKLERIILAKIAPSATLLETIEDVRKRRADASKAGIYGRLQEEESLVVPLMNFDVLRRYSELEGHKIVTTGTLQDLSIALALQSIQFRLDERGARIKSEAMMGEQVAAAVPAEPRQFVFDKPFLLLLERVDAERPYFAMWVDNSELLVAK